jgi:hypothetical protein
MGNRDIKKDAKKKKKKTDTNYISSMKPILPQPELVKKPKRDEQ